MSVISQFERLNNVKSKLRANIAEKGVDVPADADFDSCAELVKQIETKNADTVDGWHVNVISDGSDPENITVPTITFVYTVG